MTVLPLPKGRRQRLREHAYVYVELIVTIILDALVLLTAASARFVTLKLLHLLGPVEQQSWAVRKLEWIGDVGIVSAALIFTIFDLTKRVIIAGKGLVKVFRKEAP